MSNDAESGLARGGPRELPRLPLKVVVLSELLPRDPSTGRSAERRQRVRIDRESFEEAMGRFGLSLNLAVADRLTGGPTPVLVELPLRGIASFRPDSVSREIPAARELIELRSALVDLKLGKCDLAGIRARLLSVDGRTQVVERVRAALNESEATSEPGERPPSPRGDGHTIDALLEMVDLPQAGAGPAAPNQGANLEVLDGLIRTLVRDAKSARPISAKAVDAAIREIDGSLTTQVGEVVRDPEFRRLAAAWLGLKFLVDRTDFREPIRIEVVATGRESLLSVFDELVYGPESETVPTEPVSIIVVDHAFSKSPEDIDLLRALSERGAVLGAPVLASVSPAFLGLAKATDIAEQSGLLGRLDGPEFAQWRSLRESEHSRWLGLIFNRLLLRAPWGPDGPQAKEFEFRVGAGTADEEPRLWGHGAWAVAALATRSFARIGWCTDIMGQRTSGTLEDLPVCHFGREPGRPDQLPLETTVSDAVERDVNAHGVMTLTAALNSDRAVLRFAPSGHKPRQYADPIDKARARLQSTLPFQMFVGRVVQYCLLVSPVLVPGRPAEDVRADYARALRSLLASAGAVPDDAVDVTVVPDAEDPSRQELRLKIHWRGFQSLPEAGLLELRWPLGA